MQQQPREIHQVTFLVVGGGIAGVSCAETIAICCPDESILLLTEASIIKTVTNLQPVARYLHRFDVKERSALAAENNGLPSSVKIIVDKLTSIESAAKRVLTLGNRVITYKYLCISTGGRPHLIESGNSRVLGIRDTDSVLEFQRHLKDAQTIVLVGNGGIASELAYALSDVELHWVVKDNHISSTFVDPGAAHFLQENPVAQKPVDAKTVIKRMRYSELLPSAEEGNVNKKGAALGPDWHRSFELSGSVKTASSTPIMHYKAEVLKISEGLKDQQNVLVTLTNGDAIECNILVSATGVNPRHDFSCDIPLNLASDGGISVNEMMETNLPAIYAAGDACTAAWDTAENWFQMRLWTQARQMGAMAGRSMAAVFNDETIMQDFCFELFGHVTELFGYSVVLLGRYNGQGLGTDYEILLRSTPGKEYIKFVIQRGHLRGAILIGNTELAETCENLILNKIDLTPYGDDILNPNIDIEDYFD